MEIKEFIEQTLEFSGDTLIWINGKVADVDGVESGHYLILNDEYMRAMHLDTVRLRHIRGYSFECQELVYFNDDNLAGFSEFKSWEFIKKGYAQYDVINFII